MRYLPDNNLSYPIFITLNDGSAGSGFFLNYDKKDIYIVTARHVLCKKESDRYILKANKIEILAYDRNLEITSPYIYRVNLSLLPSENIKISDSYDVVVIKIGSLRERINDKKIYDITYEDEFKTISKPTQSTGIVFIPSQRFKKYEEVLISNDVIIFGYPVSLGSGSEIDYKQPLLRKGIVAGKNINTRTIILDCPAYQGNSGGLVLEIDPVSRENHPIGVISAFIPFIEKFKSVNFGYINSSIENSGYSVVTPIDVIIDLINK